MRLEDFDTGISYNARVLSSQRITPASSSEEVREIVLEVERSISITSRGRASA